MLNMVVWDVQHGSATYIKTPNGTHIVQDLGTGDISAGKADFSPLLHLKRNYGVSQLDYVIITHPHKDHIDDIFNFDALSPRVLRRPNHLTEQDIRQANQGAANEVYIDKYWEINSRYSAPVDSGKNPQSATNNGGVDIQLFSPSSCGRSNLNNHSLVTVMSYAQSKIILPGDNEPPSWKELLESPRFRNAISGADILLAPHHGRQSAFYRELFDHFKPRLTIISDGPSDSSAVGEYGSVTRGWVVHHKDGSSEERKCVTTRRDGAITIKLGYNEGSKPFIAVYID